MKDCRFIVLSFLLCPLMAMAEPQAQIAPASIQTQMASEPVAGVGNIQGSGWMSTKRSVAPVASSRATETRQGSMPSGNNGIFTHFQTGTPRTKYGFTPSTMSGGGAAGGLMNTGSRYSSNPVNAGRDGGTTVSSTNGSGGPHRTPQNPLDPFLNPLGDGLIALALLALAYVIYKVRKRMRA